jgi:predicted hydrocarbon binding protein
MTDQMNIANGVMRASLEGIQDIVGENGLKSILNYSHLGKYIDSFPPNNEELEIPLEDLHTLYLSLKELFGSRGASSIQLRVGRENARRALENRPAMAKSIKVATRLIPEKKKMNLVLQKFAEDVQKNIPSKSDTPYVDVKEEDDCFLLINKTNFESEDITSETSVCNVSVGMLQYIMEWVTGHPHHVEEIECRAMGHPADVFRITKARKED